MEQDETTIAEQLAECRETCARLNRRCQAAESAARARIDPGQRTLGRALANWAAADYRRQLEERGAIEECGDLVRLAVIEEIWSMHPSPIDGWNTLYEYERLVKAHGPSVGVLLREGTG